jgi:hypothetical protein
MVHPVYAGRLREGFTGLNATEVSNALLSWDGTQCRLVAEGILVGQQLLAIQLECAAAVSELVSAVPSNTCLRISVAGCFGLTWQQCVHVIYRLIS